MLRQKKKTLTANMPPAQRGLAGGKRFLAIIGVIVILVCCFSFNVSINTFALTQSETHTFTENGYEFGIAMQFYKSNGTNMFDSEILNFNYTVDKADRGYAVNISMPFNNGIIQTNENHYYMVLRFIPKSGPQMSNDVITTASCLIGLNADYFDMWQSNPHDNAIPKAYTNYSYDGNILETPIDGVMSYPNTSYTQYCKVDFAGNKEFSYLKGFYVCIPFSTYKSTHNFSIALYDLNFKTVSVSQGQTDQIIQNQDKNTQAIIENEKTWFQKQMDFMGIKLDGVKDSNDENTNKLMGFIKDLFDGQREEADDTADSSVGEVKDVVPDYSNNLLGIVQTLGNSLIHEDTNCIITMPAIKIPPLKYVSNKTIVLLPEQEINVSDFFAKNVNSVVRYCVQGSLTLFLSIYAFKEFYGTIFNVISMKKGDE